MPVSILKLCPAAETIASDADLLARFTTNRDEVAFAELVRRHGPVVHRVCRRLIPAHADDAFQAVFLVLACRPERVRKPGAIGSWLAGVAGRVARQMRNSERCRAGHEQAAGQPEAVTPLPDTRELAAVLDDELTQLPDGLRAPVVLCLIRGRTHAQAAADLGGSVRTLRRRLDRAKELLCARLERRGVIPTVATALVAGVGEAVTAFEPELVRRTVSNVFQFLAGGAPTTVATVAAKGVVNDMTRFKLPALVATTAGILVCFGVVWSQDPLKPVDPAVQPPLRIEPPPAPTLLVPSSLGTGYVPQADVHTANFVVHAQTPVMARAIAAEAEHQRRVLALQWLGKELPAWSKPCVIRFALGQAGGGATTFTFGDGANGVPTVTSMEMALSGEFLVVMTNALPHEVTHTVLASFFGKPLPRWADEGLSLLAESATEQFNHDVRVRELLNAGRGIRLRVLVRMTEYPKDMIVLYAQGHSLTRFLAGRTKGVPVLMDVPVLGDLFKKNAENEGRRRLLTFLHVGTQGNTAESWNKAAKEVYGFESIDDLEEAWLEWLKKPISELQQPPDSPPRATKPKPDSLHQIPPTELPLPRGW
ncbi:ECF RNA polymerase sigma factor SigE [Gemmata sp. SH-PL17]|uniref:RNA polymerase sigma factor n=1 Tax=Gemmata sp. SH-PL17 TaxID=1630693 RepID=UPI00078C107A|nr:sigma-70 family RNA polymerase sigma factor [Gemmata sp. SH-PL17]AMV26687.1 ECF RNA polymerase sigma factor SigE [Gemmata sp. SH-PL17]